MKQYVGQPTLLRYDACSYLLATAHAAAGHGETLSTCGKAWSPHICDCQGNPSLGTQPCIAGSVHACWTWGISSTCCSSPAYTMPSPSIQHDASCMYTRHVSLYLDGHGHAKVNHLRSPPMWCIMWRHVCMPICITLTRATLHCAQKYQPILWHATLHKRMCVLVDLHQLS